MNFERIINGTVFAIIAFWVVTNAGQINQVVSAGGATLVTAGRALWGGGDNPRRG